MDYYIFRSTTEKLPEHVQHITESGDTVVGDPTFVGGRDWVLLCSKGGGAVDVAALNAALANVTPLTAVLAELTRAQHRLANTLNGLERHLADAATQTGTVR